MRRSRGSAHQRAIMHIGCMYGMKTTIPGIYLTIVTILKLSVCRDMTCFWKSFLQRLGDRMPEISCFRGAADVRRKWRMLGPRRQHFFDGADDGRSRLRMA